MPEPFVDEPPPILGSWRRVYTFVLLLEIAVISAIALVSHWSY